MHVASVVSPDQLWRFQGTANPQLRTSGGSVVPAQALADENKNKTDDRTDESAGDSTHDIHFL